MRRVYSALFAVIALAATPGTSAYASGQSWAADLETAVQRLGPTRPRRAQDACSRWQGMAARLGETYAGFKIRHLLANARSCAFGGQQHEDQTWGWPWRAGDVRAELPPHLHGRYGAWEIRCEESGLRRRCALSLETSMTASLDPEATSVGLVSHVVIDNVAGRESLIWRLHVARSPQLDLETRILKVEWQSSNAIGERFDACGRAGCMAEAEPTTSAEIASAMWSGESVAVSVTGTQTSESIACILPSFGFRQGLGELIKLRRIEQRTRQSGVDAKEYGP